MKKRCMRMLQNNSQFNYPLSHPGICFPQELPPHRKPQVGPHQLHTLRYIKLEIRRQVPSQAILSLRKTMMMLMSLPIQKIIILKQMFLPFGKQKMVHRAYFKNNQEWLKFNKCPGPKASGNIMELYKINTF